MRLKGRLRRLDEDAFNWLKKLFHSEEFTDTALNAFRTYLSLRFPDEWKAANATRVESTSANISITEPDITAEQRRPVIKYLAEQLTPKEVPVAPGLPSAAAEQSQPTLAAPAVNGRSDTGAAVAPPAPIQFGNCVPDR